MLAVRLGDDSIVKQLLKSRANTDIADNVNGVVCAQRVVGEGNERMKE